MKHFALAICLFLGWGAKAQNLAYDTTLLNTLHPPYNIESYFLLLPTNVFQPLQYITGDSVVGTDERKELLQRLDFHEAITSDRILFLDTLNKRKAFLRLNTLTDGEGYVVEMTYWNRKNKPPLIALCLSNWAMCCHHSELSFYSFNGSSWKIEDPLPAIELSNFVHTDKMRAEAIDLLTPPPLSINLPLEGKNITVYIDDGYIDIDYDAMGLTALDVKQLFDHMYRNEIELEWTGKVFKITN